MPKRKGILKNLLFLMPWLISLSFCPPAKGLTEDPDPHQNLYFVQWQGHVFSWEHQGFACWVTDTAGNLRFEIMADGVSQYPENLHQLMSWNGDEGWTAISVGGEEGTFSRWQEEWQELPPSMNIWLMVIAHVLASDQGLAGPVLPSGVREITPGGRSLSSFKFVSSLDAHEVRRLQLPAFTFDNSGYDHGDEGFRGMMTGRGRGRGGRETILNLMGNASSEAGLVISSTHRPGKLVLAQLRTIKVSYQPEDVFLPWWPLSMNISLED